MIMVVMLTTFNSTLPADKLFTGITLECQLISEMEAVRVLGRVERTEQSEYEISYQPTTVGKHRLHIKIDGQHLRGSPFSMTVVETSIWKIGSLVGSISEVNGAHSIALDHRQELIISGVHDHYVHIVDPREDKRLLLPSNKQLYFPMGVAVDREGNILLVDSGNHRVLKLTTEGQVTKPSRGKEYLQFNRPVGIAFNNTNSKVYVTESYNHRVHILNPDLTFFSSFGGHGNGKGQFTHPRGITCDGAGNVYVTENHRVQVFTAEGKFLRTFGKYGENEGELNSPADIAVDANGLVYVSEANNHRVSVFTPEGRFVKTFGKCGREPGQFMHPHGITVGNNGVVYVCDLDNNRFQMF